MANMGLTVSKEWHIVIYFLGYVYAELFSNLPLHTKRKHNFTETDTWLMFCAISLSLLWTNLKNR